MTNFNPGYGRDFLDVVGRSALHLSLASDCLAKSTAFLEEAKKDKKQRKHFKNLAVDLKNQAIIHSHNASTKIFFHPQYNLQPFANLLVFLQRLPPKKAAETLKHMIAIVTNHEIETFMQEEETKIARGKKSLWVIANFRIIEFVVKTALFCERIKFKHKMNFSTNFLGFRVASLQCQGKMAQMRSIAFERLEMFQKRRHNLLTISAFLCFLFRKIFQFPRNFVSLQMKRLLEK
jgi:hypothetical protein